MHKQTHILLLVIAILVIQTRIAAQNTEKDKATVSGYVKDKQTGETLIGANVFLKENKKGAVTNNYGFFSITSEKGNYTLVVSYLGYKNYEMPLDLSKNQTVNLELETSAITTEEIVITDERSDDNTQSTKMGQIELKIEEIKKVPALFGEIDVLKTIQLLPGVKGSGEGNSGFYVRGGGPDQNLILLDNAVVYNAAHLFGFFSVFNSDAIKNVNLIKGGMPANYGGRLSSVLDISMKEGNMKKFSGDGGIGLISSRLTFHGPIKKDKASFLISGRRTYLDLLLLPFSGEGSPLNGNSYYFYDINAKINWQITPKDRIFVSGYFGQDVFSFKSPSSDLRIDIPWGNGIATMRYIHTFGNRLFMSTTLAFTDYQFQTKANTGDIGFNLFSGIRDYSAKMDWDWVPSSKHNIKFGADYTFHEFTPSTATAQFDSTIIEPGTRQKILAHDFALYVLDEWDITPWLKVNAGLRFNYFQHTGPFKRFIKDQDGFNTDTIEYGTLANIADYARLEPRLSVRFRINENISIKAAFTQNYQNLHLANLATVSLPTDIWLPSTSIIRPQLARQYSLGYFHNFLNNMLETSVEIYYKEMYGLVEYKDNSSFAQIVADNPDNILAFGNGRSWGAEFFFKKRLGKITGWVGYTLSWTQRYGFNKEEINYDGDFFYPRYDRRHDLSLTVSWDIDKKKKWNVAAVFVFSSGNVLAVPTRFYFVGNTIVPQFDDRDNFRMQPYHRMDLSVTYQLHKNSKWSSNLNLSIYNVYSRLNPFFVYFDIETDENTNTIKFQGKQVSLFPIIPALTWNFSF
jgi:hypothetical protein